MKPAVLQAIDEIKTAFPGHQVDHHDEVDGGAVVRVNTLSLGATYTPDTGGVTFRIPFNYPHADIYPHYLPAELARCDRKPLGEGFSKPEIKLGPYTGSAVMVSRKSNRWNPAVDTAALKLAKVLDWIRGRS